MGISDIHNNDKFREAAAGAAVLGGAPGGFVFCGRGISALPPILSNFEPITLEEMSRVKLMNRIDTKYVTTLSRLGAFLRLAAGEYRVQETDGLRSMPYSTTYFDTPEHFMFSEHVRGKKTRQKIRYRTYDSSALTFLEIKSKNNKGRTRKKRVQTELGTDIRSNADFITSLTPFNPAELIAQIENHFKRITLVNKAMTERLTIDTGLRFHNLRTGRDRDLDGIAIIELKRDGHAASPILGTLRELRIMPSGFSKYCIGMAMTNPYLRQNRLKPRLRRIEHLLSSEAGLAEPIGPSAEICSL